MFFSTRHSMVEYYIETCCSRYSCCLKKCADALRVIRVIRRPKN